jgi:hypothetical protein
MTAKFFPYKVTDRPVTLLDGKPYVPQANTNILETFRRLGWVPPSERLNDQAKDQTTVA